MVDIAFVYNVYQKGNPLMFLEKVVDMHFLANRKAQFAVPHSPKSRLPGRIVVDIGLSNDSGGWDEVM